MKILVSEKFYKQHGKDLVFQQNTKNELHSTTQTKEEPYFALKNILNDFRLRDLWSSEDVVTELELYFDDELIAVIQPCFTINGETYVSRKEWSRCYLRNGDETTIGSTTVTNHFYYVISEKEVRDILIWNFIDGFPWGSVQ